MKMSLLALISTAVATPHYGANPHSKFHSAKALASSAPYGTVKPYPTGGWSGPKNCTDGAPYPTGHQSVVQPSPVGQQSGVQPSSIDVTSTSTTTIYTTVIVQPTGPAQVPGISYGQCGPATVTVTAMEQVTVTVTPGGGAGYTPVPQSPVAPVESKHDQYPASSPEAPKATSSKAEYAASSVPSPSKSVPSPSGTPSSGNTYHGAKRGLAYNTAELCKNFGGKFGFGYNWGQVENNDIGTNFIPMMHKPDASSADEWLANVDKAVKKGSTAVMGFNECDHVEQCNMSPEAACAAWKSYMNPIKSAHANVTIIGPSVTNGPAPMGLNWLSRFHDCCPDAIVDATNIHFYDIYVEGLTLEHFKAHIEQAVKTFGKKVWITEFGLNPGSASSSQAVDFLKGAMEYLDNSSDVQGYSWFMVGTGENQLNTLSGLSPVGEIYASY